LTRTLPATQLDERYGGSSNLFYAEAPLMRWVGGTV
jgi:hypothetical protein